MNSPNRYILFHVFSLPDEWSDLQLVLPSVLPGYWLDYRC